MSYTNLRITARGTLYCGQLHVSVTHGTLEIFTVIQGSPRSVASMSSYVCSLHKSKVNMCRTALIIDQGREAHEPNVKSIYTPLQATILYFESTLPGKTEKRTV